MTIHLIRHGQAITGTDDLDPGLAPIGHDQARITAALFDRRPIARLITSPLRRTRETAGPIAETTGLQPEIRHEVSEVFDPAMPPEERRNMIGPFMASRWSEQNETLNAWRRRVVETLHELALDASGDIIVVSHYIAIGAAIGEATGDDRVVPTPIANTSITTIEADGERLRLVQAASTSHLPPDLITGLSQAMAGGPPSS